MACERLGHVQLQNYVIVWGEEEDHSDHPPCTIDLKKSGKFSIENPAVLMESFPSQFLPINEMCMLSTLLNSNTSVSI